MRKGKGRQTEFIMRHIEKLGKRSYSSSLFFFSTKEMSIREGEKREWVIREGIHREET